MENYDICMVAVKEDAAITRRLTERIRKYRLPGKVSLPDNSVDYRRIFEDVSETPFDEHTKNILEHSRYLAVICSPATRENRAVLERLDYFRQLNHGERIIPVIVRGEPAEAFPRGFIEKRTVKHMLPDMTVCEREETIEPIAADLRADNPRRQRQLLRYETVRITASVLGLHPDILEQRHRTRNRIRIMAAAGTTAAVFLVAACIFLRLGFIAKEEGDIAAQQTRLSMQIAERTTQVLPERFADNAEALQYVNMAVEKAKNTIEELEAEEEMPSSDEEGGS